MYTSPTQLNRSDSDAPCPAADPVLDPCSTGTIRR